MFEREEKEGAEGRTEENDEKNNEANRHEFAHIYSSFQSIILQLNFFRCIRALSSLFPFSSIGL